jgi:hypothetical protein
MKRWILALTGALVVSATMAVAQTPGPYTAQIQRAIHSLLASNNTWTGTNTFTGSIVPTGQILAADGTAALPGIAFGSDHSTGMFTTGSGLLFFSAGGASRFSLTTTINYSYNKLNIYSNTAPLSFGTGDDVAISRDGAPGILSLKGTSTAEARIYGDATKYLSLAHNGTSANLSTSSGNILLTPLGGGVYFNTNVSALWQTDGGGSIGANGASRPLDLFLSRNATIGGNVGIGGVDASTHLALKGTPASVSLGIDVYATYVVGNGGTGAGIYIEPTFVRGGAAAYTLLASGYFAGPAVSGAGAATIVNTASVYVAGAYAGTVTGANYALWVAAGASRFGGAVTMDSTLTVANYTITTKANTDSIASGSGYFYSKDLYSMFRQGTDSSFNIDTYNSSSAYQNSLKLSRDGVFTTFGRNNFGGTSSSFPALSLRAANGLELLSAAGTSTLNDPSTATGTLADRFLWGFSAAPTLTSTNASVVYTDASAAEYWAPVAGTNVTITNPWAATYHGNAKYTGALAIGATPASAGAVRLTSDNAIMWSVGTATTVAGKSSAKQIGVLVPDAVADATVGSTLAPIGLLIVSDFVGGYAASVLVTGGYAPVLSSSSPGEFSVAKDNAGTINIYWETDRYKIQNKRATNIGITLFALNTGA